MGIKGSKQALRHMERGKQKAYHPAQSFRSGAPKLQERREVSGHDFSRAEEAQKGDRL
jgi:hypothetical protein